MYFFNCTCLCLSGYKPYIIKKTKFESDCQIIGSAQNESFHVRRMKRTCFNPCRGLRGIRRSRPAALTSNQPKGFPVALRNPSGVLSKGCCYNVGDKRARNARPYGGRTPSTAAAVPLPRRGRSWGFAGQSLRPCRRLDIGALRSPLSPFARPLGAIYTTPGAGSKPCSFQWGLWGS